MLKISYSVTLYDIDNEFNGTRWFNTEAEMDGFIAEIERNNEKAPSYERLQIKAKIHTWQ